MSRGQETRLQAASNLIGETYDAIRSAPSQRQELLYKELAKTLPTTWYIMETAQYRLHDVGGIIHPRTLRKACRVWTDPRRLRSRSEGVKTVISPNAV